MNLREVPSEALEAEVKARKRCVDCRSEYGAGWFPAGLNRVRCGQCQQQHAKEEPSMFDTIRGPRRLSHDELLQYLHARRRAADVRRRKRRRSTTNCRGPGKRTTSATGSSSCLKAAWGIEAPENGVIEELPEKVRAKMGELIVRAGSRTWSSASRSPAARCARAVMAGRRSGCIRMARWCRGSKRGRTTRRRRWGSSKNSSGS